MPPNETYQQKIVRQRAEEHPSYFMCGKKSLPLLIEEAEKEAEQMLKEFSAFYDTRGKLGIKIEPIDHAGICYSVGATLTWGGLPMRKPDDPCSLLFLELNNAIINRMIQLGMVGGAENG